MESAVLGVVLDSSVAIEAERQQLNVGRFLRQIIDNIGEREVALCSITIAELAHGSIERIRRNAGTVDECSSMS